MLSYVGVIVQVEVVKHLTQQVKVLNLEPRQLAVTLRPIS